jgi:hypothetical protein
MSKDMKILLVAMAIMPFIVYFLYAFNLVAIFMWLTVVPLVLMSIAIIAHRTLSFFFGGGLPKTVQDALGRRE